MAKTIEQTAYVTALVNELVALWQQSGITFSADERSPAMVGQRIMPTLDQFCRELIGNTSAHDIQILERNVKLFRQNPAVWERGSGNVRPGTERFYMTIRTFEDHRAWGTERDGYNERTDYNKK